MISNILLKRIYDYSSPKLILVQNPKTPTAELKYESKLWVNICLGQIVSLPIETPEPRFHRPFILCKSENVRKNPQTVWVGSGIPEKMSCKPANEWK